MKCIYRVATFACFLSVSLAFNTHISEETFAEVMSYVNHIMEDLPIMRSSVCYDTFIPLINSLADQAKDLSQVCVNTAASKRDVLLLNGRAEVMAAVKRIKDSLTNCSNSNDMTYLQCLKGIVDEDKQILDMIAKRSAELIKEYADRTKAIDKEENDCIDQVVQEAKRKSDQAFADLKECMMNNHWPDSSPATEETTTNDTPMTDSESDRPSQRTEP